MNVFRAEGREMESECLASWETALHEKCICIIWAFINKGNKIELWVVVMCWNAKSHSERPARVLHLNKHSFIRSGSWVCVLLMCLYSVLCSFYHRLLKMNGVLLQGSCVHLAAHGNTSVHDLKDLWVQCTNFVLQTRFLFVHSQYYIFKEEALQWNTALKCQCTENLLFQNNFMFEWSLSVLFVGVRIVLIISWVFFLSICIFQEMWWLWSIPQGNSWVTFGLTL